MLNDNFAVSKIKTHHFRWVLTVGTALLAQPVLADESKASWNPSFAKIFGDSALAAYEWSYSEFNQQDPKPNAIKLSPPKHITPYSSIEVRIAEPTGRAPYPITLVVIDRDNDGESDEDSDLWIADWDGDAIIDRVVSYTDKNADNTLDWMFVYYSGFAFNSPGGILGVDIDQDNHFFSTTDFEYYQPIDQWKSDYQGDAYFSMFFYDSGEEILKPTNESPFCFYDTDKDGFSNIAIRITSKDFPWQDKSYSTFRYSLDIDNDANEQKPYDYDFSLSGIGKINYRNHEAATVPIGTAAIAPSIEWEQCENAVFQSSWESVMLTWDLDDRNYSDETVLEDPSPRKLERWEGVINMGSGDFPQVGGPPSKRLNTRSELLQDADTRPLTLYFSPVDKQLHLSGAKQGLAIIDVDDDGAEDLTIQMDDQDDNGVFDQWTYIFHADQMTQVINNSAPISTVFEPNRSQYQPFSAWYLTKLQEELKYYCDLNTSLQGVSEAISADLSQNCADSSSNVELERAVFQARNRIILALNKHDQQWLRLLLNGKYDVLQEEIKSGLK